MRKFSRRFFQPRKLVRKSITSYMWNASRCSSVIYWIFFRQSTIYGDWIWTGVYNNGFYFASCTRSWLYRKQYGDSLTNTPALVEEWREFYHLCGSRQVTGEKNHSLFMYETRSRSKNKDVMPYTCLKKRGAVSNVFPASGIQIMPSVPRVTLHDDLERPKASTTSV